MNQINITPALTAAIPSEPFQGRDLIDGRWVGSADGSTFDRDSPAHGVLASHSAKGVEAGTNAAIAAARKAFDSGAWSRASGKTRTVALNNLVQSSTGVKEYNVHLAGAILAALPTLAVYIVAGRYFVSGQVFEFAVNMEKAVAFEPVTEERIRP